jgi:Sulfotransferase family
VTGALPNLIVIGAMKCGTTSLHHYLDQHPDVAMSRIKELNFFFGPADTCGDGDGPPDWARGNWHRGTSWYAAQFDPTSRVRGEASPGYTSPSHRQVAGRMAAVVPDAQLVYVVRDPVGRAVSQYCHHRREGCEPRDLADALLDPGSQYVARGRYAERLAPFLDAGAHAVTIVAQEELDRDRRATLRRLLRVVGVDDEVWSPAMGERRNAAPQPAPQLDRRLRDRLADAFRDDAERLRELAGRDFPGWTV